MSFRRVFAFFGLLLALLGGLQTSAYADRINPGQTLSTSILSRGVRVTPAGVAGVPGWYAATSRNSIPGNLGLPQITTSGSNLMMPCRISYYNLTGGPISQVRLTYAGFTLNGATPSEDVLPNAYDVEAFVEYPAGTWTRAGTGRTTISASATGLTDMDTATLATPIPNGAHFWVQNYGIVASAGQKFAVGYNVTTANGDAGATLTTDPGAGITPATLTSTQTTCIGPALVLAYQASRPAIVAVMGDSWTVGQGDSAAVDIYGYNGGFMRAVAGRAPALWMSRGGTDLSNSAVANKLNGRLALMTKAGVSKALYNWLINDLRVPRTQAQIRGYDTTLVSQIQAIGVDITTTTAGPNTTSTDAWTTPTTSGGASNQTPYNAAFAAGGASTRALANQDRINKYAGQNRNVDITNCVGFAANDNEGVWPAYGGTSSSADGLHPKTGNSTYGHVCIANDIGTGWLTAVGIP